ncbi:GIY-YIG nuclease family protein [Bythopirellula polymerisocia]|nr:GIY-YIG nuclease family protein [Bythopirellula polymerisocia]
MNEYFVYIMSNQSRTLYIGVTNDLERRVLEHKSKLIKGFTSSYNLTMLAWYDSFSDINQAIECEKKIKGWRRSKKVTLIEEQNPRWEDLAENWQL